MAPEPIPAPNARGAMVIITNDRGEILMHLRDDIVGIAWPGRWALPAGGCEPGESPARTIVRELDEEAGLAVEQLTELCEVHDTWAAGRILTVFTARYDGTPQELRLTEGVKLQFFEPEHLDTLAMPPCVAAALERYHGSRRAPEGP
jgi:8-oxo-dGTP diphosphatase